VAACRASVQVAGVQVAGVQVAVLQDDDAPVGFLPFERLPHGVAAPVGGSLCDFQGLIARPDLDWSPTELLRACGLAAYRFDHVLASQTALGRHAWRTVDSPLVDLSAGFESYCRNRTEAGSRLVAETLRKMRKAEREIGPLRLEPWCDDPAVFDAALRWKREQYRRIGAVDHLAEPWRSDVLRRIWGMRGEEFSGMLSALYLGDQLAAVHLGMFSRGVLHCWFPAYGADDNQLARYSPGIMLWVMLARESQALGIRRIDLGKGDERYKRELMTGATQIAEGAVELRHVSAALRKSWHGLRELVKRSPLRRPVQGVLRKWRSWSARVPVEGN
jgi:CelD/BcsL family acetyltransferase involved in cellulose biosynthesis